MRDLEPFLSRINLDCVLFVDVLPVYQIYTSINIVKLNLKWIIHYDSKLLKKSIKIYSVHNPQWTKVKHWIGVKQKGICRLCRKAIIEDDEVVRKLKHKTVYYHLVHIV